MARETNTKNTKECILLLNELISHYKNIRDFALTINVDPADVFRWRTGRRKITPKAVVNIIREHPDVKPYELNPEIFPEDVIIRFI